MWSKLDIFGVQEVKQPAFKAAILAVFSILTVHIVGFFLPAITLPFLSGFPIATKFIRFLFLSEYSFFLPAAVSSLVFYKWAKENIKNSINFLIYTTLTLAVLIPRFDYQSIFLGYTDVTTFTVLFIFLILLFYLLSKYFEENKIFSAFSAVLIPIAVWFILNAF